jgi:hypothetical protein
VSCKVSRYDWCDPHLDLHQGGKDVCELMVFQIHAISDVVEVDSVIWVVSEPGHQYLTNGEGQALSQVMRHVHSEMEHI